MEITKEYFDDRLEQILGRLDTLSTKDAVATIHGDLVAVQNDVRSVKNDLSEIKETLARLDERDVADSNAFAKTLVQHDDLITATENEVKRLKLKSA